MDEERKFWVVWNPHRNAPTFKHFSSLEAVNEAERLARVNPAEKFYVLEVISMREVNNMRRVEFKMEVPF